MESGLSTMDGRGFLDHIRSLQCLLRQFVRNAPGSRLPSETVKQMMREFSKINVELDRRKYGPHSADNFLQLCQEIVKNQALPPRQTFVNIIDKWERDGVFDNVQEEDGGTEEAASGRGEGVRRQEAQTRGSARMTEEERRKGNGETKKEERREESTRKMEEAARKKEEARKMQEEARKMEEEARKMEEEEARKMEEEETRKMEEEEARKMEAGKKEEKGLDNARKKTGQRLKGKEEEKQDELQKRQEETGKEEEKQDELQKRQEETGKEDETVKAVKKARFADPESSTITMNLRRGRMVPSDEEVAGNTGLQKAETKSKVSRMLDGHNEFSGKEIEVNRTKATPDVLRDEIIAGEMETEMRQKPASKKSITIVLPHPCVHCNVRGISCTMTNSSDNRRSCDNCHASEKKCAIIKNIIFLAEKAKEQSEFGLVAAKMLKAVVENVGGENGDDKDVPDEGETEFSTGGSALIEAVFNIMPRLFTEFRQLRDQNALLRAQCDLHLQRLEAQDRCVDAQVGRILKKLERLWESERDGFYVKFEKILEEAVGTNSMQRSQGQEWIEKMQTVIQDKEVAKVDVEKNSVSGVPPSHIVTKVIPEVPRSDVGKPGNGAEGTAGNTVLDIPSSESVLDPISPATPLEVGKTSLLPTANQVPILPSTASEPVFHRASPVPQSDEPRFFPTQNASNSEVSSPIVTGKKRKTEDLPLEKERPSKHPQLSEPTQPKTKQRGRKKSSARK